MQADAEKHQTARPDLAPWSSASDSFFEESLLTGWLRCEPTGQLGILYCNNYFCRLMGCGDRRELLRTTDGGFMSLVHPDDRDIPLTWLDASKQERTTSLLRLTRKDGAVVWVRTRCYSYNEADGLARLLLCCVDVSELMEVTAGRWELELELARVNEDIGLISDSLPCGLASYECSPGAIVCRYLSDGFYRLTGYTREEYAQLSGDDALCLVCKEDRRNVADSLISLRDNGGNVRCSCRIRAKDGVRWVELRGASGGRTADTAILNTVLVDVTEQHAAEEALRVREEEYRLAIAQSGKLVYRFDVAKDAIYLPQETAELFDLPARIDGVPQSVLDMGAVAQESRVDYIAFFKRIRAGEHTGSARIRHRVRGGASRWFDARFTNIFGDSGQPVSAIILFLDVTDQRQSDIRNLLDRERLLVALGSVYPVSIGLDLTHDSYRALGGREILSRTCPPEGSLSALIEHTETRLAPEHQGMLRRSVNKNALQEAFRTGSGSSLMQFCLQTDGGRHWVELSVLPIPNEYDDTVAGIAMLRYIDEQKAAQEELRISETETRVAMSHMGKMVCLYDAREHTLTMPERYAAQFGVQSVQSGLPASAVENGMLGGDTAQAYADFFKAMQRGDKNGSVDYYIRWADGSWHWEHAEFIAVFDSAGCAAKAVVAVEDVTDAHMQADETARLREQELILRTVTSHSNRTIYDYDVASGTARLVAKDGALNPKTGRQLGLTDVLSEYGCLLPESQADLERLRNDLEQMVPEGGMKLHFRGREEKSVWIDLRYTMADIGGEGPRSAVLSLQDVTREHERELAYERYRQTVQRGSAADSGAIYVETDVTADVVEMLDGGLLTAKLPAGISRQTELVDFMAARYFVAEDRERFHTFFSREHLLTLYADGRRELTQDWLAVSPNSGEYWVRTQMQMIQDPYSGHIKCYTAARDVSAEKKAALDVQRKAQTDGLTGILNKSTTEDEIRRRLADPATGPCALLFSDLDDLKNINDSLGHAQGDRALALYAGELKTLFRRTDVVGRVGGDEFVVFLSGVGREYALRGAMNTLMRRVSALRIGENRSVGFCVSAGIALGKAGVDTYEELSRRADKALYHVKGIGKSDYAFYTPDMERPSYHYAGHNERTEGMTGVYTRQDVDRLLSAMCALYPLVLTADLTRGIYNLLRCNDDLGRQIPAGGRFDDLVDFALGRIHPDDRGAFTDAFSRERLLAAFGRAQGGATLVCRQLCGSGTLRRIAIEVVFTPGADGCVTVVVLARPLPD